MGCSASHSAPAQFTTTITTTATATSPDTPSPTSIVHHAPIGKGDSHHFVCLTSTTYGSLTRPADNYSPASSPDSVINTWELMEGLDDGVEFEILSVHNNNNNNNNNNNINDHGNGKGKLTDGSDYVSFGLGGPYEMVEYPDVKKPLWKHLSDDSLSSKPDNNAKHATLSYTKTPKLLSRPDNKPLGAKESTLSYTKTPNLLSRPDNKPLGAKESTTLSYTKTPKLLSKLDNKPLGAKESTLSHTKTPKLLSRPDNKTLGAKESTTLSHTKTPNLLSKQDNKPLGAKESTLSYTKTPALLSKPDNNKELCVSNSTLSYTKTPETQVLLLLSKSDNNEELSSKHTTLSNTKTPETPSGLTLPGCEDRIVLYYTSLRGIRKTYEDCCEIRLIFQGFRVFVDERDISLDSSYRDELKRVFDGKGFSLPQVFIRGKHVGGADEVKRLHEDGKLFGLMKGFRVMDSGRVCDDCGDVRFVPCTKCNGSRKYFVEGVWRAVKCPKCNENGLIRCGRCS